MFFLLLLFILNIIISWIYHEFVFFVSDTDADDCENTTHKKKSRRNKILFWNKNICSLWSERKFWQWLCNLNSKIDSWIALFVGNITSSLDWWMEHNIDSRSKRFFWFWELEKFYERILSVFVSNPMTLIGCKNFWVRSRKKSEIFLHPQSISILAIFSPINHCESLLNTVMIERKTNNMFLTSCFICQFFERILKLYLIQFHKNSNQSET